MLRSHRKLRLLVVFALFAFLLFALMYSDAGDEHLGNNDLPVSVETQHKKKDADVYGKLPMHFEPNVGQTDESVKYLSRGNGYSLFLTPDEAVLHLQKFDNEGQQNESSVVRMRIEGALKDAALDGELETAGRSNYFLGNDPDKWVTDVKNYERVRYRSIYKGIDLVYYGSGQRLEYDFIVRPGHDPGTIRLAVSGVDNVEIEQSTGDLLLKTGSGVLRQLKPFVYQEIEGERVEVASSYAVASNVGDDDTYAISFKLGDYDPSLDLTIDPILSYGSYLGGNAFDEGRAVAVDSEGNAYIVGTAASRDFPTTSGVLKPVLLSRTSSPNSFWYDAFVTKVSPDGTSLVFSTFFGGRNGNETGSGVALDANGNVVFSGTTMSPDMPVVNAFRNSFGGTDDGFAAKLDPSGSALIYSTYLGGNNTDLGGAVAVNRASGDAVFTGYASSGNFPTTPGAYKERLCDDTPGSCNGIFYSGSYLVKLTATGQPVYSTLFNAGIADVVIDASDNAVIGGSAGAGFPTTPGSFQPVNSGGSDGLIAKLNPSGSAIVFGTYLGGGLHSDRVRAIALDQAQNIYVTGQTENTAFPTTAGAFDSTFNGVEDGFVTKLNPEGSSLIFSTFLGGTARDQPFAIGLASDGDVFVAGETTGASTFPLRNSLMASGTIFATRLRGDGSALVFSSILGNGGAYDLAVDSQDNAYLTGHTTRILVTPEAFQPVIGGGDVTGAAKDAFIVKLAPTDESVQTYRISGTVTDQNFGYNNNYAPIIATITGAVNRSIILSYASNGVGTFEFGSLPAGGNYRVSVKKVGFESDPESVLFTNLGANQFADFVLLRNREPESTITSPVYGATFNAGESVTITAEASDPDGHPISKVDFVAYNSSAGSVPLGTDTTAPYEFTWENLPVGTWALYAYPTDSIGLRGDTQNVVHIFVSDPTGANVSITGPTDGQSFSEGSYVPVSVNVSTSVNVVEIRDQNNNLVLRMNGSPWSSQYRAMQVGTFSLTATAFTQTGQQSTSAPVTINITPINHRITGRIVDNITGSGIAGATLDLVSTTNPQISAQAVTDTSGSYVFTGLGTTPNDGVVITPTVPGYSVVPAERGIGYLGYIDWNNQNFTATAQTQISVEMTSPTNGDTYTAPATIPLAATASSTAGTITKVDFFRRALNGTAVFLGTDTTAPYEHVVEGVDVGSYTFFARATDSTNALQQSGNVSVSVILPTVSLSGQITGPDGNGMPGVTVYIGGGYAWTETTDSEGRFTFPNYPGGRTYYITPYPENGITYTPVSRTFTNVLTDINGIDFVASTPNQAPTIQLVSPTDGASYTMPEPIPIVVNASDPDNNIQRLRVTSNNGSIFQTIVQTTNSSINTVWQPATPGTYVLRADVLDTGGLSAAQEITITVNQPAPVSISGRIVDRGSQGIEEVNVAVRNALTGELAGTAATDAEGRFTVSGITTFITYDLEVEKLNYTFAPRSRRYFNLSASRTDADFTGTLQLQLSDFDGDGESDLSVWRPSDGVWHVSRSQDNGYVSYQFGGAAFGDVVVPGNYDGDKHIDYAVYRFGTWYILNSSTGVPTIVSFGLPTDKPISGDFDGDGKTDIAVWRESNGTWHVLRSSDGGYSAYQFGLAGDVAIAGDYDGDGKSDSAIWRPSTGVWYILQSSNGQARIVGFGLNGDIPITGDFDGDKSNDIAVFRPSTGVWYYLNSSDDSFGYRQWGLATDKLVPGDYDRDGKTDFAVFRESEGNWYILPNGPGPHRIIHFGAQGDVPIPSAFIR